MIRALTQDATVDVPEGLVDRTRYVFRSSEPDEGVVVTAPPPAEQAPDAVLDQRLSRLETALSPDFQVTERYGQDGPCGTTCAAAYETKLFGAPVSGQILVVPVDATATVVELSGALSREVSRDLLRSLAPAAFVGCPAPPGRLRAFAGPIAFDLPLRFGEPKAFEFALEEARFTIELRAQPPGPPEALVYSDMDHPPKATELPPLRVEGRLLLQRWSIAVMYLGRPARARVVRGRAFGSALLTGRGPEEQASAIEAHAADLARTLLVNRHV